jgi:hypothetical protein
VPVADFTFNVSLGRVVELYGRVKAGDPSGAVLMLVVLKATAASDATLRDCTTLAAVLSASPEATNSGYARKTLAATAIAAVTPDHTNDLIALTFPAQTWNSVAAAGGNWAKLVVCYAPTAASATSAIVPMTCHDLAVVPNGTNVTATPVSTGFFRAT